MTDLGDAIAAHYKAAADDQRSRAEAELRKFKPDPALDAAVKRLDAQRAANPSAVLGAFAASLDDYRRKRDRAAALPPDPDTAA